jgi:hypothetical protein
MSVDMAFQGVLTFSSAKVAKKALAAFDEYECLEESVVQRDNLTTKAAMIRVDCFTSAPASMWESSCGAIECLAELAKKGHINAQLDGGEGEDAIFRVRYLAGGDEEELDGPFPEGLEPPAVEEAGEDLAGDVRMAAMRGDAELVKSLLDRGASIADAKVFGVRNLAVLEVLLARGLDPRGDGAQYSPLCDASRAGNAACIELLIARGAGPDEFDTPGRGTALMLAARTLRLEAVQALLGGGASPHATDAQGNTALLELVWIGNDDEVVDIARVLIGAGADPAHRNAKGETFLDRAAITGTAERLVRLRALVQGAS